MQKCIVYAAAAIICIGKVIKVTRTAMNVAKGVGAAVALGAAVGVVGSMVSSGSRKRAAKKRMRKAADKMGTLLDSVGFMFK